jgi:hypothetical protein
MLKSSSKHCRALKGIRTKCNIKIETNGEIVGEDSGELLFADYGISGIVVMNLSKYVNDERLEKGRERTVAIIDFVPEMNEEQLRNHYDKFATFSGILPTKLCSVFERQADSNVDKIIKCIKSWRLIITGTKGFNFAQITKGGVPNAELKKANESIYHDALYIVGELTDNQFDCGGFNLDYAFSSGILTADDINNRYSKKYYD